MDVHGLNWLSQRMFFDCRDAAVKLILRHLELRGFRLVSELTEFLCWPTPTGPTASPCSGEEIWLGELYTETRQSMQQFWNGSADLNMCDSC